MNEQQKSSFFASYNDKTHRLGRLFLTIGLVAFLVAPFIMGFVVGAMPDIPAFAKAVVQIAIIYIPSCVVEFLIYMPMLGAGGSYVAFLTGNIINMKIPCALNARDIAGTKTGTPENEVVSTLAIATSSLVTTIVIMIGVFLLIPLRPVLEAEVLQPAFNNVVPALFGAMATKYFRKGMKLVAIPLVLMAVLFICVPSLISSVATLMIISGAITIAHAWLLFRKKTKEQAQEQEAQA